MTDTGTTTDYESMTVAELKEELAARGLHTSGLKDELITRLQEDDAKLAAGETQEQADTEINAEADAEVGEYVYTPPLYSPFELPANTAAAQMIYDANPELVDPNLTLPPDRQDIAVAAIQAHVDEMAAVGVIVEDPRLTGGTDPNPPDPPPDDETTITAVTPDTGPAQKVTHIVVTGTALGNVQQVYIGSKSWHNTVLVDDTTINTDTDGNTSAGTYPLTAHLQDSSVVTGPDFTFGPAEDPEITGVDPNTAPMGVETQVTLTGTGLAGVTGVQIGPNEATDLTATDTEVTFNITGLAPATDSIVGLMVGDRLVPSNFTFTFTAA